MTLFNAPTPSAAAPEPHGLPIAAVERETGLSKDTLRVWEKRYGFPRPLRDAAGDRLYPADQVEKLLLIRRLLDAGMRPGKVVELDRDTLRAQVSQASQTGTATARNADATRPTTTNAHTPLQPLLDMIGAHDPQALRQALVHAQLRMGLAAFVTDLVAPLTHAVGQAWAQGRFEIFEEHLFTEVVSGVLRHAIATLAATVPTGGPTVLLTTLPQEMHGLGLLMVEALLALEGCHCISLGTQTPLGNVVQAVQAHRADVLVLSFTNVQPGALVLDSLRELRHRLPDSTAIWVGGACSALYQKPLEGITAVQPLEGLSPLVVQWRHTH